MFFNTVIASAILAYLAAAAPTKHEPETIATVAPIESTLAALSLTQQLHLADASADRFALLQQDEQF